MITKVKVVITGMRKLITGVEFKEKHRSKASDFTRKRILTFPQMIMLILKKGAKSLQLMLNESFMAEEIGSVSNSAFTQARSRLKHTAFIELIEKLVSILYGDDDYKRFMGFRLLAIDGSKIILPDFPDTMNTFGQIAYKNKTVQGNYTMGLASVLYDVLNKVAVDSVLAHSCSYEVDLAIAHLRHTKENDLMVADRGYASYFFLATLMAQERDFVIRCSAGSFGVAQRMLKGEGKASQIVTLLVPSKHKKDVVAAGLPTRVRVRFVRIRLNTGEYEVIVTSLLDETLYTVERFAEIYHLRWGIEGFYGILKTRLGLENFSGKTAESVYQDFYSTVYLTGLEALLTASTNQELAEKSVQNPQQVNKAVSFNAIKNQAFDLLYGKEDDDIVIQKLMALFLMNPVGIRKKREVPRIPRSDKHLLNFHRRKKKICF